jgi:hypothetical protein
VSPTQSEIFTEERNLTQNALVAIVGYHKDIGPHWKLGLSTRLPSMHVSGEAEVTQTTISNGAIQPPVSERGISTHARIPWRIALGLAHVVKNQSTWAFDVSVLGPMLALRSENIEYTFGGYYTGGRGRSVQRINQAYEVVPKVVNVFTMLVGTSYSF